MSVAARILSLVQTKTPAEQAAAIVATIQSKLDTARDAEALAEAAHGAALLTVEAGLPADTDSTSEALAAARRSVETLAMTLTAAKAQLEAAQAGTQDDELAARWESTRKLAARALAAAREVERHANSFAANLEELNKLNAELFDMAPERDASAGYASKTHHSETEKAIRQHLRHRGVAWAYTIAWDADGKPWGHPTARGFADRIAEAHEILLAGQRGNV